MRIVVNGWFWQATAVGSGQYLAALAVALSRVPTRHHFVLAVPEHLEGRRNLPVGWESAGVRTPLAGVSADLAKVWFEQISFPLLCRRLRADIAFVPYWGSPWLRPCPVVVTVHDLIPLLLPLYRGGRRQRLYSWLVSLTARRATAIITDSDASRRDIVTHLNVPFERVHAIHLAAESCVDNSTQHDAPDSRQGLPDGPFLLYLGGFDARKNVLRTIQGYAKFINRCDEQGVVAPALVVAGKLPGVNSDFAPDPRLVVRSLGLEKRVYFLGWVDDTVKATLYRRATGVLFVSEYEGFGLPVLEAMACEGGA